MSAIIRSCRSVGTCRNASAYGLKAKRENVTTNEYPGIIFQRNAGELGSKRPHEMLEREIYRSRKESLQELFSIQHLEHAKSGSLTGEQIRQQICISNPVFEYGLP